jgi:hypothetical protein
LSFVPVTYYWEESEIRKHVNGPDIKLKWRRQEIELNFGLEIPWKVVTGKSKQTLKANSVLTFLSLDRGF